MDRMIINMVIFMGITIIMGINMVRIKDMGIMVMRDL